MFPRSSETYYSRRKSLNENEYYPSNSSWYSRIILVPNSNKCLVEVGENSRLDEGQVRMIISLQCQFMVTTMRTTRNVMLNTGGCGTLTVFKLSRKIRKSTSKT